MYISNNKYRLERMSKENLVAAATLCTEQFILENEVWSSLRPTYEEGLAFMIQKFNEILDWEEDLRKEGILAKDGFINYVRML